ncbi:hypothetical protein SEVIR_1G211875v4 [Setaria viridis]
MNHALASETSQAPTLDHTYFLSSMHTHRIDYSTWRHHRSRSISSSKSLRAPTQPPSPAAAHVQAPPASRRRPRLPPWPPRRRLRPLPAFLIGLLYHRTHSSWDGEKSTCRRPLFAAAKSSSAGSLLPKTVIARLSDELAGPYDPVASRGGLLVLRLGRCPPTSLCVCNPVAGRSHVLPPKEIYNDLHCCRRRPELQLDEDRQRRKTRSGTHNVAFSLTHVNCVDLNRTWGNGAANRCSFSCCFRSLLFSVFTRSKDPRSPRHARSRYIVLA